MKLTSIDGITCIAKKVNNVDVYDYLREHEVDGTPNIVRIVNETIFYEYVNGETLDHIIKNHNLKTKEIVKLLLSISNVLEKINNLDIIHNGINAENIIIDPNGKVFLVDFGAAKFAPKDQYGMAVLECSDCKNRAVDLKAFGKVVKDVDFNNNFGDVVLKCQSDDMDVRYHNYYSFRKDLQEVQLSNSDEQNSIKEYFSPSFIILIVIVLIIIAIIIGYSM